MYADVPASWGFHFASKSPYSNPVVVAVRHRIKSVSHRD
jgi:hypothetical protein